MNSLLMLQNAHLRMCVDPQGGSLLSLVSLQHQRAILREGHGQQPGDCGLFPMLPVANRVAGNRFMLRGGEVVLPHHEVDEHFFLHGERLAAALAGYHRDTKRLFATVAQLASLWLRLYGADLLPTGSVEPACFIDAHPLRGTTDDLWLRVPSVFRL